MTEAIQIKRKVGQPKVVLKENRGIPYFSFPLLEESGLVKHGFSTRFGGVSSGDCASMNFGFNRGEKREVVLENFRRMADALDMPFARMVNSQQTHTTNVYRVKEEDAGRGVIKELGYTDIDGLITDVRNLPLVTFYADCVPLYLLDKENRAIGLSHAGWRGTAGQMGKVTIEAMKKNFGSRSENILVCIGPSICKDCYEVSEDVADEFRKEFHEDVCKKILADKGNGKFQLDLWEANRQVFLEAGILPEHIAVTDVCTCCNPSLLFSHRASKGKRGNLAAFLCLK